MIKIVEEKILWPKPRKEESEEEEQLEDVKDNNAVLSMNFSEIPQYESVPTESFEGEKISIDSILNKEVAILKFRVMPSSFFEGNFLMCQIMDAENNLAWFTTGSTVLEKQLKDIESKDKLPIRTTIKKVKGQNPTKRYYTLS